MIVVYTYEDLDKDAQELIDQIGPDEFVRQAKYPETILLFIKPALKISTFEVALFKYEDKTIVIKGLNR